MSGNPAALQRATSVDPPQRTGFPDAPQGSARESECVSLRAHRSGLGGIALASTTLAAAFALTSVAAGSPPPRLSGLGAWASAGWRLAFVATVRGRDGFWVQTFGSAQPRRIGPPRCGQQEEIDQIAAGPKGGWACLERTAGNTEAFYSVDLLSATGMSRHVASAGGVIGAGRRPVDSIPWIFGDGSFVGYVHVLPDGVTQLIRISTGGQPVHVADLEEKGAPDAVSIAGNHLAILHSGLVSVYTTAGRPTAKVAVRAASLALTRDRLIVRTTTRQIAVYTLDGRLVHSYKVAAHGWTAGLAAYGGYAVYLGANKAVRAMRLATGRDRTVVNVGAGWFFDGLTLQAPGAVAPLTQQQGKSFLVTMRFIPVASLRRATASRSEK